MPHIITSEQDILSNLEIWKFLQAYCAFQSKTDDSNAFVFTTWAQEKLFFSKKI
jgi:hypothetical protein